MLLFERGEKEPFSIPTRAQQVADVSGAGDTVIATLAVAKACGATVREAATMANRAAGIVIEELGIVPIYRERLFDALMEDLEEVN
jgi:D-beta-D-heptose 7-phosphate kinase/D-beta-D-heptose 1-phosphate adenosyltransferase